MLPYLLLEHLQKQHLLQQHEQAMLQLHWRLLWGSLLQFAAGSLRAPGAVAGFRQLGILLLITHCLRFFPCRPGDTRSLRETARHFTGMAFGFRV